MRVKPERPANDAIVLIVFDDGYKSMAHIIDVGEGLTFARDGLLYFDQQRISGRLPAVGKGGQDTLGAHRYGLRRWLWRKKDAIL